MAIGDKPPQEYDAGKIQALFEKLDRKIKGIEKTSKQELQDLSKELEASISEVEEALTNKIDSATGEESVYPSYIPIPQNLKNYEYGFWGFAHVDPFMKWKYVGMLVGYEFYGSPNAANDGGVYSFDAHEEPYTQIGTHWGNGPDDIYLNTEHPTDPEQSFVLDNRLVRLLARNQLILENLNRSTKGKTTDTTAFKLIDAANDFSTIEPGMKAYNPAKHSTLSGETYTQEAWAEVLTVSAGELTLDRDIFTRTGDDYQVGVGLIAPPAYGIKPKYMIKADGVKWNNGDQWRIKDYPSNKLFTIGSFCTFTKRLGNFYVKARSVGKGHSFSEFTEVVLSEGISSTGELDQVRIVRPIHNVGVDGPDGVECDMVDGIPSCLNHGPIVDDLGNVDWSQITAGTREIAHYDVFGFERSVIELVYETLDIDDPVVYKVLVTNDADDTEEGDVS